MWPAEVEQVAAVLRAAGAEGRLEELAPSEDDFPGTGVSVYAFDCDGRRVVTLVPADRRVDPRKLGCADFRPAVPPAFPFASADVRLDRGLLGERMVWIHAGSQRHVLGISPVQLARLVRARTADIVADT
jgi:prolyl-tRNA editing enzyme YbaK/EbsC (Cys-tRNA(Pro) deacylase)